MAFSKYDPYRPQGKESDAASPQAARRAKILQYGWWLTMAYTLLGFLFLGLFWLGLFP